MSPAGPNPQQTGGDPAGPVLALLAIAALLIADLYGGAQLATVAVHHQLLPDVSLDTILHFARHLPEHAARPADAWPTEYPRTLLTGPIPFWIATVTVWLATAAIAFKVARLFAGDRNVGQHRDARFGAPAWSHEATRSDLVPLIVKGPTPGRTIFGVSAGKLLATENRPAKARRRQHERQGDRGGVLVVGPARCGKTVIAIGAILEHDWGPLIASSVKTDLLQATIRRRKALDDVAIFDPLDSTEGKGNIGWSPLPFCTNAVGAQAVTNNLIAATPTGRSGNDDFWTEQAGRLAWALLYAASIGSKTMRDVVLWTAVPPKTQKGAKRVPTDKYSMLLHQILTNALSVPEHADDAELAFAVVTGIWDEAPETCSSIYAASQILFKPWEDTRVAKNSGLAESINLDWLLAGHGRRSLYICMPSKPGEAERFAIVFGGLISTLTDEAYERRNRDNKALPNVLLVFDEAGNTAASWLPSLSTTCASVGITLMTFWQSLAQIAHRYGDQTNTLVTNHTTKIFFGGISDAMTGDAAAKLSGNQEVLTRSATTDRTTTGRHSTTENTTATPLVSADLVRQIKPFHALCIHGTLQPIHLRARKWWRNRALRARAEGKQLPERTFSERLRPYAPDAAAYGRDPAPPTKGSRADRQRATGRHQRGGTENSPRNERSATSSGSSTSSISPRAQRQ